MGLIEKEIIQNQYSLDTKYKSIQDFVKGVKSRTQIVNELGVPKSTVARWIKDKDKIFSSYQSSKFEPERKRSLTTQHEDLEEAVHKWFINDRAHNLPVSGPFLKTQVQKMAEQLGYSDFKGSSGWLQRFQTRHVIDFRRISKIETKQTINHL